MNAVIKKKEEKLSERASLYHYRKSQRGRRQSWQFELQLRPSVAHRVGSFGAGHASEHGVAARGLGGAEAREATR